MHWRSNTTVATSASTYELACTSARSSYRGDDIAGITVHIAQRVCAHAVGGQVLVTERVVDLTSGANLTFEHDVTTDLKGVPDTWRLHAAANHPSHQQ